MGFPPTSRVYLDTSVLIAIFADEPKFRQYCTKFTKQVRAKEVTGVVNNLAVFEAVNKTKYTLAINEPQPPTQSDLEGVRDDIMESIRLYGFELQDIGKGFSGYDLEPPLFERVGSFILTSPAHRTPESKWKVLGIPDAIHVALAENAGVDYLLAADTDYDYVKSKVEHKLLWEVYK